LEAPVCEGLPVDHQSILRDLWIDNVTKYTVLLLLKSKTYYLHLGKFKFSGN
jgi:hypothetical protein